MFTVDMKKKKDEMTTVTRELMPGVQTKPNQTKKPNKASRLN